MLITSIIITEDIKKRAAILGGEKSTSKAEVTVQSAGCEV